MGNGDDMSEKNGLATRIAQATDIHLGKVCEVVKLALEELHRISIIDEKGPTAAVMEACFSFGDETAFHLIGLFVSEHDYHGRDDDAGIWSEVTTSAVGSLRPWAIFGRIQRSPSSHLKKALMDSSLKWQETLT
jgi:hypothetical protein